MARFPRFALVVWLTLPFGLGNALGDLLGSWSPRPAFSATVLAWAAWAAGIVALMTPRPAGFTYLRIATAGGIACALASVPSTTVGTATLALSSTITAGIVALSRPVARAAASNAAYGDEQRFPLRSPFGLAIGPLPLAALGVGTGTATGPLLLADGRLVSGVLACAIGFGFVFLLGRSLHSLDRRFVVLVPAGLVVVDPLAMTEPLLITRDLLANSERYDGIRSSPEMVDLRIGTTWGSVLLTMKDGVLVPIRRGRRRAEM